MPKREPRNGGTHGSPVAPSFTRGRRAATWAPAGQSPAPPTNAGVVRARGAADVEASATQRRGVDPIGPYTLLRLERGGLEPGIPGQFFMLQPPERVLPRPMSLCCAPRGELGFLIDPIGPGTRALASRSTGRADRGLRPARQRLPARCRRGRSSSAAGSASHRSRTCREELGRPPALLGFRSAWHAEAAALVPNAEVVIEPTYVTEALPVGEHDILACGPEPMLEAVRALEPDAQLAWEAPMACGYGACYGCAVEIDGELKRLCVEGPVLGGRVRAAA